MSADAVNGYARSEPAWADQKWMETKMPSGPVRSALQLKLQGQNRAATAVLVMTMIHTTLLFGVGGQVG